MGGFSQITGDPLGSVINANNVSFDGTERGGVITTDAQLLIGSSALPHIRLGTIVAADSSLTVSYVSPNIVIQSGGILANTYTTNSGIATPSAKNLNVFGTSTNGIQTSGTGNTLTVGMASPYADGNFSFESQTGGVTRTLTVQNTVDAASSQATQLIKVAGTSSGDVWTQYSIGSTNSFSIGQDNSSSDSLKFTYSASGTVNPSAGTEFYRYDLSVTPNVSIFGGGTPLVAPATVGVIQSSTTASLEIQNTNSAAGSAAALGIRVNGSAAGNPQVTYDINGVAGSNWNHGVSNSESDTWVLNNGNGNLALGNRVMISQLTGETNWPLQPAFLAYQASVATNVSGTGTGYTLGTTVDLTEVFDQNADFDPTTGTFTAPVTGRYSLGLEAYWNGLTAANAFINNIITSNQTFTNQPSRGASAVDYSNFLAVLADMDAGDTCTFQVAALGEAGNTSDLYGQAASPRYTYCYGKLEC